MYIFIQYAEGLAHYSLVIRSHLGPFNSPVLIHVCQINRAQVSILGSVSLPVQTFRRNHTVEEWFPIVPKAEASKSSCLEAFGEMSLSVRVQDDMVLPGEGYAELDQVRTASSKM